MVGPQHFTSFRNVLLRLICPEDVKVSFTFRQRLVMGAAHIKLLQAFLELGQGDSSTLVGVKVVKERPQHVRFDAICPAKGTVPLFKVELSEPSMSARANAASGFSKLRKLRCSECISRIFEA